MSGSASEETTMVIVAKTSPKNRFCAVSNQGC